MEIKLNELPIEHPLRNKPLVGMFYYSKGSLAKNEVRSSFGIAKKCYNDLTGAWLLDKFVYIED